MTRRAPNPNRSFFGEFSITFGNRKLSNGQHLKLAFTPLRWCQSCDGGLVCVNVAHTAAMFFPLALALHFSTLITGVRVFTSLAPQAYVPWNISMLVSHSCVFFVHRTRPRRTPVYFASFDSCSTSNIRTPWFSGSRD